MIGNTLCFPSGFLVLFICARMLRNILCSRGGYKHVEVVRRRLCYEREIGGLAVRYDGAISDNRRCHPTPDYERMLQLCDTLLDANRLRALVCGCKRDERWGFCEDDCPEHVVCLVHSPVKVDTPNDLRCTHQLPVCRSRNVVLALGVLRMRSRPKPYLVFLDDRVMPLLKRLSVVCIQAQPCVMREPVAPRFRVGLCAFDLRDVMRLAIVCK